MPIDAFDDIDRELERRAEWHARRARNLEWTALLEWWALQRELDPDRPNRPPTATTVARIHDLEDRYGETLARALAKWARVERYKRMIRELDRQGLRFTSCTYDQVYDIS
jgi:hypothetical protein